MESLEQLKAAQKTENNTPSVLPEGASHKSVLEEGLDVAKEVSSLVKEAVPPMVDTVKEGAKWVDKKLELEKPVVSIKGQSVSRRAFLGGAVATAVAAQGIARGMETLIEKNPEAKSETSAGIDFEQQDGRGIELGPKIYDMGPLAGRAMGGLFAYYLGMKEGETTPKRLEIDFGKSVKSLWQKKVEKVQKKKPAWAKNTERAREVYTNLYHHERKSNEGMSLENFITKTDAAIREVNQSLNWNQLNKIEFIEEKFTHLTDQDVLLVKQLAERVTGTMLLGFSITELMPALRDHKINVAMYRFLLENAGTEFLRCIPALYDVYLSAGLFQFTSFAVYDMGDKDKRGASAINALLPKEKQIPGSVVRLRSDEEQMKAAQLFAIRNLAFLVEGIRRGKPGESEELKERRIQTLWQHVNSLDVAILQYISSAHHLPGDARTAFIRWIDKGFSGSHADLASAGIRDYIKKSNGGYQELERVLAQG